MSDPNHPATLPIGNAIVSTLQMMQYAGTSNYVYVQSSQLPTSLQAQYPNGGVQLGQIKDVTDLVANGNVCAEVYISKDQRKRYTTGGRIKDYSKWYVLSLCSMDNATTAEQTIINVADAIVLYFLQHSQLGGIANTWLVTLQPEENFVKIPRDKLYYRGHILELEVLSEWVVSGGFVV